MAGTGHPPKIINQLLQFHVLAAPERNPIQFHSQASRCEAGDEQFVTAQLLAGADGERVLTRETYRLPFDESLRRALDGNEQPLIRLWNPWGPRTPPSWLGTRRRSRSSRVNR